MLAERAFRAARSDVADFGRLMAEAEALPSLESHVTHGIVPWGRPDVFRVAQSLGAAARRGHVALDRGTGAPTVRRARAPATDGKWTVLPNYEVLVPADARPDAVFRLACTARLESVDRVTKFVLDRTTVARRGAIDGLTQSAVEILAERSAHRLPETVAAAVAEWDMAAAPLRAFLGATIVASSPEQCEALRGDADAPTEIAPGVFVTSEIRLKGILDRARKRGLAVGAVERRGGYDTWSSAPRRTTAEEVASAAARFRSRFGPLVEAQPKAAPKPPPPSRRARRRRAPPRARPAAWRKRIGRSWRSARRNSASAGPTCTGRWRITRTSCVARSRCRDPC